MEKEGYLSSRERVVSLIAFMESIMSVASSGPNIASIIEGSSFDEAAVGGSVFAAVSAVALDEDEVEVLLLDAAHSKSCFVRLSMLMKQKGSTGN